MDKILVAGASGFIGSNLVNYLLKNTDNQIYGIDNFSSSDISNIYMALKNEKFSFYEQDIRSDIPFYCDIVYYLAQSNNLEAYKNNKYSYIKENLEAIDNILKYCSANNSKLIYISEISSPEKLNNPKYKEYISFIRLSLDLISTFSKENKVETIIIKIPSIFGENFSKHTSDTIFSSINSIFEGKNITIENDYYDYFTYINDILEPLKLTPYMEDKPDIIEVSSNDAYLLSDIIKLIINSQNSKTKLNIFNNEVFKPNFKPNTNFAQEKLSFTPSNDLQKNILSVIEFYKNKFIL